MPIGKARCSGVALASSHILFQSESGQTVFRWHVDNDENNGHCSAVVTVIAFLGGTSSVVAGVDFHDGDDDQFHTLSRPPS